MLVNVADHSGDDAKIKVTFSYKKFAAGYGGDYGGRLRLYRAGDCDPKPTQGCAADMVPVKTRNDSEKRTVSAVVDIPAEGVTFAIAASGDSTQGTYGATALSPSSSWSAGGSAGGFSWSYPIKTPTTPGSLSPSLGLAYSSQSTDGRTAATNNQGSWIGEGFTYEPGYIERRYKPCSDDGHATSGDLCWAWDNATIMLDGRSGELVKEGSTWRLSTDDGSIITRATDTTNDDDNNEYWKLTTTDGTQYFFGLHRLPGWATGNEVTDSVWTTPVFGDDTNEPCNDATFADSHCNQAWRWNLDYVQDTNGNVISYYYNKETNYYARGGRTDINGVPYTRGGYLTRIDYGHRHNAVYGTPAPARVTFTTEERCLPSAETTTCEESALNEGTALYWPDVPWDRNCVKDSHCDSSQVSPSFWTRKRLTGITTKVRTGTDWSSVSSWKLDHAFVSNADTTRSLWLSKITRTGHYGTDIALPSTVLYAVQKPNRIDVTGDSISPMIRPRLASVDTDTGGLIDVTYSGEDCTPTDTPTPASNGRRCYPVRWQPPSAADTITDWFHKYVVTEVAVADRIEGSPVQRTHYDYNGAAAWRYTKPDGITKTSDLTWGDWRGYKSVTVNTGYGTSLQTRTDYTYFRGMHGDKDGSGGTKSVSITDSVSGTHTDYDELAGQTLEAIVYDDTAVISKTITTPWRHTTATATHSWRDQTATYVRPATTTTLTSLETGAARETKTTNRYDTTYGRVTEVDDYGDTSTAADNRCTRTWYADDTDKNMVSYPNESETVAAPCSDTVVDRSTKVISHDRMHYDGLAFDAEPVHGDVTKAEELDSHNGTTPTFVTLATTGYDSYGRVTRVANARDIATTSSYTDTDGLNTRTVVTNALGHTSTTDYISTLGEPSTVTDPNGKATSFTYDGLGRLSAVWLPNRSKASGETPNMKFTYQVETNAPVAVKTETLKNDGATYRANYEIFDGWLRSRQTQTPGPGGGRLVTDTFYNPLGSVKSTNDVYDAAGAPTGTLLSVADGDVYGQTGYSYDHAGRVTKQAFSVAGQPKWSTTIAYGGDRVHTTPPSGGTATTVLADVRGNTTELRQYHGGVPTGAYDATSYTYGIRGQLEAVTNQAGETWTYKYDQRGRRTTTIDPDAGTSSSTYDELGRVLTSTDGRDVTLAYEYDNLDRQTKVSKVDPEEPTTLVKLAEWVWDSLHKGHLAYNRSYDGDLTFTHVYNLRDAFYRPIRETYSLSGASAGALAGSYQYNRSFNLDGTPNSQGFPTAGGISGESVVNTYDDLARLTSMSSSERTYAGDITHTPTGLLDQVGLYAGAVNSWLTLSYERGTNRLTNTFLTANGARPTDTSYTYDPAGNVTSIIDTPTVAGSERDAQCFRYDHLRRLTKAWTTSNPGDGATACNTDPTPTSIGGPGAYWHEYGFNTNGNRTTHTVRASNAPGAPDKDITSTYNYDPTETQPGGPHLLRNVTDTVDGTETGKRSYTYDAGYTLTRPGADGATQTLTWDPRGHLATLTEAGESTSFSYDADGARYLRRDPDGATLYLPGMELRQPTGSGTVTATRYYALPGGITYVRTPTSGQYQTSDHHGTATTALDPDTGAATHRRFDPYGNPRGPQPLAAQWSGTRGFVDGTKDPTGLTHLGAREYDPGIGRFISADPIVDPADPQQMHGYSYANNNPVTLSDPTGLIVWGGTNEDTGEQITATPKPGGGYNYHGTDRPDPKDEVRDAADRLRAAKARQAALKRKMIKLGKLFLNIVMEVTGIQAGVDCFLKGDIGGCVETAVNVITGLVGGLLVKIGAKYAFKWKAAAKLAGKVKTLIGGIIDVAKNWGKVADGVADAQKAYKAAKASAKATRKSDEAADAVGDSCKFNSFTGNTKVRLANGKSKPISKIKPGDKVLASKPEAGMHVGKVVTHVWVHKDTVVDLKIEGEIVTTTEDHPFWNATEQQWQRADQLDPGDKLLTPDGYLVRVEGLDHRTARSATAYNLTVADIHTYYVIAESIPVLVHNCERDALGRFTSGENADAARGRATHKNYKSALGDSYDYEFVLPSGRRPDAIDWQNRVVRELKSDAPSSMATGRRQLRGYLAELEEMTGQSWTGYLDTYRR